MRSYPDDVLERIEKLPCPPANIGSRRQRVAGIEDYLFIGGDRLSNAQAAARLGVTKRTIERWRAVLSEVTR